MELKQSLDQLKENNLATILISGKNMQIVCFSEYLCVNLGNSRSVLTFFADILLGLGSILML